MKPKTGQVYEVLIKYGNPAKYKKTFAKYNGGAKWAINYPSYEGYVVEICFN